MSNQPATQGESMSIAVQEAELKVGDRVRITEKPGIHEGSIRAGYGGKTGVIRTVGPWAGTTHYWLTMDIDSRKSAWPFLKEDLDVIEPEPKPEPATERPAIRVGDPVEITVEEDGGTRSYQGKVEMFGPSTGKFYVSLEGKTDGYYLLDASQLRPLPAQSPPADKFTPGQKVRITGGPFTGFVGKTAKIDRKEPVPRFQGNDWWKVTVDVPDQISRVAILMDSEMELVVDDAQAPASKPVMTPLQIGDRVEINPDVLPKAIQRTAKVVSVRKHDDFPQKEFYTLHFEGISVPCSFPFSRENLTLLMPAAFVDDTPAPVPPADSNPPHTGFSGSDESGVEPSSHPGQFTITADGTTSRGSIQLNAEIIPPADGSDGPGKIELTVKEPSGDSGQLPPAESNPPQHQDFGTPESLSAQGVHVDPIVQSHADLSQTTPVAIANNQDAVWRGVTTQYRDPEPGEDLTGKRVRTTVTHIRGRITGKEADHEPVPYWLIETDEGRIIMALTSFIQVEVTEPNVVVGSVQTEATTGDQGSTVEAKPESPTPWDDIPAKFKHKDIVAWNSRHWTVAFGYPDYTKNCWVYQLNQDFPEDNTAWGIPESEILLVATSEQIQSEKPKPDEIDHSEDPLNHLKLAPIISGFDSQMTVIEAIVDWQCRADDRRCAFTIKADGSVSVVITTGDNKPILTTVHFTHVADHDAIIDAIDRALETSLGKDAYVVPVAVVL